MQKLQNTLVQALLKARMEMFQLENEEDGLETVETVILVGVVAVIAVVILQLLTGSNHDGNSGLIRGIFDSIATKLKDIFGADVNWTNT